MGNYLNFELSITAMSDGRFRAQVDAYPQALTGEDPPQVIFQFPYDSETLNRLLLILSGKRRSRNSTRAEVAREFGETLYGIVFAGRVGKAYEDSLALAEKQDKKLRVRLNLEKAGRLVALPWEFLRQPEVDFLALSRRTPLVHYSPRIVSTARMDELKLPLRILVMISAPDDLPPLKEMEERRQLDQALYNLKRQGLVEVEYLEEASLRNLQRRLREGEYHIFHYIGHSFFDPLTGVGTLALEDPYTHRKTVRVRGEALARELHEERGIRLVVLNSCEGARYDINDPFSGIASSLVQRGIPAVVAQQFEISDEAAVVFAEELYRALAQGATIEDAVSEARRAIANTVGNAEWATPVLYLFDNDARRIFDFSQANRTRWVKVSGWWTLGLVVALLLFILGVGTYLIGQQDLRPNVAPPTATPVPDVDLVVGDVRLSPRNPQPGSLAEAIILIENRGSDPSPPFTYEWQANIFDASSTISERLEGLPPGATHEARLTYRYGWWGTFISETRVDTGNEIVEQSEQNNSLNPVRTDNNLPLIVDFNEPLPNGEIVRRSQVVQDDLFVPWGFSIRAEAPTNRPECAAVVPWLKFIGAGQVALGTGLPNDLTLCADADLVISFLPRTDNNPAGVRQLRALFPAGTGNYLLTTYRDAETANPLRSYSIMGQARETVLLASDPADTRFSRIFSARLTSEGTPLRVLRLELTAP